MQCNAMCSGGGVVVVGERGDVYPYYFAFVYLTVENCFFFVYLNSIKKDQHLLKKMSYNIIGILYHSCIP